MYYTASKLSLPAYLCSFFTFNLFQNVELETQAVQLKDKLTKYVNTNKPFSAHKKPPLNTMPSIRARTIPYSAVDVWSINSRTFCSPSMETLSSIYTTVSAPPDVSGLASQVDRMMIAGMSDQMSLVDQNKDFMDSDGFITADASQFMDSVDDSYNRESVKGKPLMSSLSDKEREMSYTQIAKENKQRVAKMRKAMTAAETIQKAWKTHQAKK